MDILKSVFGENAKDFSFNSSNNLVFSGSKKNLTRKQKALLDGGLSKLMTEETTTNVIFEVVYTAKEGENEVLIDTKEKKGEGTFVAAENPGVGLNQNYVVVNPNIVSVNVNEITKAYNDFYKEGKKRSGDLVKPVLKKVNPTILTFHGLGHIIYANSPQDKVLDFENLAIDAYNSVNKTKISKSQPDEDHN